MKRDAPSGTALMLGEAAADGRGHDLADVRGKPRDGIGELLIPENTWEDKAAYKAGCEKLAKSFVENFKKYTHMSEEVVKAGPKA